MREFQFARDVSRHAYKSMLRATLLAALLSASSAWAVIEVECPDGTTWYGNEWKRCPCCERCPDGSYIVEGGKCPASSASPSREAERQSESSGGIGFFSALLILGIYLLPTIAARVREHPNVARILAFNCLLGWTVIGWAIALAWALSKSSKPPVVSGQVHAVLEGENAFRVEVVGESHYQDNLETICGPRKPEGEDLVVDAELVPEPGNPHDKNAIQVQIHGLTVGYLRRSDAVAYYEQMVPRIGSGVRAKVKARIRGGWERSASDRGHYGVYIDL
jgi:hypothetical protein